MFSNSKKHLGGERRIFVIPDSETGGGGGGNPNSGTGSLFPATNPTENMDSGDLPPPFGVRQSHLKRAFHRCSRSLLESCSKEEFDKAFSAFDKVQREMLYQGFLKYVTCLHAHIEKEFDIICQETKVCNILDMVEEKLEEQMLHCLSDDKIKIVDVKEDATKTKRREIQYLTNLLEQTEEHNRSMRAQIESLKSKQQSSSSASDFAAKMRSWMPSSDHVLH